MAVLFDLLAGRRVVVDGFGVDAGSATHLLSMIPADLLWSSAPCRMDCLSIGCTCGRVVERVHWVGAVECWLPCLVPYSFGT